MELTGKCKKDFNSWFKSYSEREHKHDLVEKDIYSDEITLPIDLKIAVICLFFDKYGYTIDRDVYNRKMVITDWRSGKGDQYTIDCDYIDIPFSNWYEEAITKTNKLYNKNERKIKTEN